MSDKILKGILIDVENQTIGVREIPNVLDEFYKIIKCDSIDCPTRYINGVKVIIVCDDMGALKENKIPSIIGFSKGALQDCIYGNVFICKFDGIDDFESLEDWEIEKILDPDISITVGFKDKTSIKYKVLMESI